MRPLPFSQSRQHGFRCHTGIQCEPAAAFERAGDASEECLRVVDVEVTKAVPEAECRVEFRVPLKFPHVCAEPFNLQSRVDSAVSGFIEHGERDVDGTDLAAASGQFQRVPSESARHVEHAGTGSQPQDALEAIRFDSCLFRCGCLAPHFEGDALKEVLVPLGVHVASWLPCARRRIVDRGSLSTARHATRWCGTSPFRSGDDRRPSWAALDGHGNTRDLNVEQLFEGFDASQADRCRCRGGTQRLCGCQAPEGRWHRSDAACGLRCPRIELHP